MTATTGNTIVGGGGDGGDGDGDDCDPAPTVCVPQNTNVPRLAPVCGNREFSIQLEAQCACDPPSQEREMTWNDDDLPVGVALSKTGKLSGTLAPGRYTFTTPAYLADAANIGHLEQTLEVLDRCLVTFLSEDESPGVPRVAAVRLDTLAIDGWMPTDAGVAVDRYDISSDGNYLAAVVDGGNRLELFGLARAGVPSLEFEHEGVYLAHAFSPDAHWLAVVTMDPATDTQLLHLVKLDGSSWQLVGVPDEISFVADLDWFGGDRILYLSESDYPFVAPFWRTATDDGSSSATEVFDAIFDYREPFYGFLTHDAGFLSSSLIVSGYVDLGSEFNWFEYPFQAASPGLSYRATIDYDVLRVDPMTWWDYDPPYASAEGCEQLRAWSQDDSTLLCSGADGYSVFEIQGADDLRKTELEVGAEVGDSFRAALSVSGNWLAFLPTREGLYVVPRGSYTEPLADEPLLGTLLGGWDFFFAPSERQLVIQQGGRLLIAQLNTEAPVEPQEVEVSMGNVAPCYDVWDPSNPEVWCGAPRVASDTMLSFDERYLAVSDVNDSVRLIPLDTLAPQRLGALSAACVEGCIKFQ